MLFPVFSEGGLQTFAATPTFTTLRGAGGCDTDSQLLIIIILKDDDDGATAALLWLF